MKILVADDDAVSRRLLQARLERWGYQVILVADGNQAWEALQDEDGPSLALVDWMMPGLDGIELVRRLRVWPAMRYVYVVILTARSDKEHLMEAMEAGADDYVEKPFDERELEARLRSGQRVLELHETLRRQATHDALTGVWNRAGIVDFLHREAARARREGVPLAVVMADIDHFKNVNDAHGHAAGDEVLAAAGARLREALRSYDGVGRYGGEEFLVVLPGSDMASALGVAERLRSSLSEAPVPTGAGRITVTASFGVAVEEGERMDAGRLVKSADEALYRAKRGGRNRVEATASAGAPAAPGPGQSDSEGAS